MFNVATTSVYTPCRLQVQVQVKPPQPSPGQEQVQGPVEQVAWSPLGSLVGTTAAIWINPLEDTDGMEGMALAACCTVQQYMYPEERSDTFQSTQAISEHLKTNVKTTEEFC